MISVFGYDTPKAKRGNAVAFTSFSEQLGARPNFQASRKTTYQNSPTRICHRTLIRTHDGTEHIMRSQLQLIGSLSCSRNNWTMNLESIKCSRCKTITTTWCFLADFPEGSSSVP